MNSPKFMAFTAKCEGIANRIITEVGLSEAFIPNASQAPVSPKIAVKALWDTGATQSVITQSTAQNLGIVPTGRTSVIHAGGSSEQNTYIVNFFLPNKVMGYGVQVTECHDTVGGFGAIIGMDIITKGDFSITNNNGHTWVSFRFPSIKAVDYCVEADKINFSGTNRNAECPCGAKDAQGRPLKYKNCHEKIFHKYYSSPGYSS